MLNQQMNELVHPTHLTKVKNSKEVSDIFNQATFAAKK